MAIFRFGVGSVIWPISAFRILLSPGRVGHGHDGAGRRRVHPAGSREHDPPNYVIVIDVAA